MLEKSTKKKRDNGAFQQGFFKAATILDQPFLQKNFREFGDWIKSDYS